MRSVFYPHLINGPFGDPALYVRLAHRREALLFDCGDLHPLTPGQKTKITNVFISHAHMDHIIGFDSLLRSLLYTDRTLCLHGPPGIIERIRHRLAGYTWNLFEDFRFVLVVREWGEISLKEMTFRAARAFEPDPPRTMACSNGPLHATPHYRVSPLALDHGGIPSLAFALEETLHVAIHKDALEREGYLPGPWLTAFKDRLRTESSQKNILVPLARGGTTEVSLNTLAERIAHREAGMKLVYVTDASPSAANCDAIIHLARKAHLLVIEAPFLHADLSRAQSRNHLTARLAGQIAKEAQVQRLLVFHHSPRYGRDDGRLSQEARSAHEAPTDV